MVKSCWICKTSGSKYKSYFRVPKILFHRNSKISQLSAVRKEKWQKILTLPDDTSGIRVCSDHFVSGNPARLLDVNDPDWVPNQNLNVSEKKLQGTPCPEKGKCTVIITNNYEDCLIMCRLCTRLIRKELCADIFHVKNNKLTELISTVLGHDIISHKNISGFACQPCIKKVTLCAKLVTFFKNNEKSLFESLKQDFSPGSCDISEEQKNAEVTKSELMTNSSIFDNEDFIEENKCVYDEETETKGTNFILEKNLYDQEQIQSIIKDNSESSDEEVCDRMTHSEYKKRKYDAQSVNIRPLEMKTLKCNNCYKKFLDLSELKEHKNFCKLFYCQLCRPQIIFMDKNELALHKRKYHSHSVVCHICGKNYSQTYLLKHFKNHFEDKRKCPICSKTLKNISLLANHIDVVHNERFSTICDICGGNFKNLKKHLVSCKGTRIGRIKSQFGKHSDLTESIL